jgi:acyl dehydratase
MAESDAVYGESCLYLDDIQVGQRFRSGSHALDEVQIQAFARQYDPQPFHLDVETAKSTMFGVS